MSLLFSKEQIATSMYLKDFAHLREDIPDPSDSDIAQALELEDEIEEMTNEVTWEDGYEELADIVSANVIAVFVGTSKSWVSEMAIELGISPVETLSPNNHLFKGYPKEFILELRELFNAIPMQGDWLSSLELSNRTGRGRLWIERQLSAYGIESEQRRANHNNRVARFYPASSEVFIGALIEGLPVAEIGWKTEKAIATELHKDESWVRTRLAPYKDVSKLFLAENNVLAVHYPPEAVAALREEAKQLAEYPVATSEMTLKMMRPVVRHGDAWMLERLPYLSIRPRTMLNPANMRPYLYYPDNTPQELLALPADVLSQPSSVHHANLKRLKDEKVAKEKAEHERLAEAFEEKKRLKRLKNLGGLAVEKKKHGYAPIPLPLPENDYEDDVLGWRVDAVCAQTDPELFFPEKGQSSKEAKKMCQTCDVAAQCLAYALEHDETFGIWGGLDARQRRRLNRHSALDMSS